MKKTHKWKLGPYPNTLICQNCELIKTTRVKSPFPGKQLYISSYNVNGKEVFKAPPCEIKTETPFNTEVMNKDEQQIILHEWCEMHEVLENLLREYEDIDGSHSQIFQPAVSIMAQIKKRTDALEASDKIPAVDLIKVSKLQDNDSHWYWIPVEESHAFIEALTRIIGIDYTDLPEAFDAFSNAYENYRTGGSPDTAPDIFKGVNVEFVN